MKTKLSLYIHIPFCVSKCRYCDFLSFPADRESKAAYIEALKKEIELRSVGFKDKEIYSIYIGGGTPSGMEPGVIRDICDTIYSHFTVLDDAEVSIEVNPGTVDYEKLSEYKESGINRISIGLQSALDEELKLLGRIHTWEDFCKTYESARACGFDNINIDLISALPGQTTQDYRLSLDRVLELKPEHISAYSLQLEEGTYLYEHRNEYKWPDEDLDRELYHITEEVLNQWGYERYEISNYSKPGYECKHNCVYWTRGEYLGLGLGAASLIGDTRLSNTSDMKEYLQGRYNQDLYKLSHEECIEEYMFLGLRLTKGITPEAFKRDLGEDIQVIYGTIIEGLVEKGVLLMDESIRLTRFGMDVSNCVLAEFLLDKAKGET